MEENIALSNDQLRQKKTQFPLAINPWGVTGLQKENSLRNELSLLNSIGKSKGIVKLLRFLVA